MKKNLLPGLLVVSALAGCASNSSTTPQQVQAQPEEDRSYRVEWIGDRPLIDRSYLSMTFGSEDGRAYGNAGCNNWFASYSRQDDKLRFGPIGTTRMMCAPALMEQEQRFLDAISNVTRWDFSDQGQLQLWPEKGEPIRLWLEEN